MKIEVGMFELERISTGKVFTTGFREITYLFTGRDVLRVRMVKLIGQRVSKINIYATLCYSGVIEALKTESEMGFLPLGAPELNVAGTARLARGRSVLYNINGRLQVMD